MSTAAHPWTSASPRVGILTGWGTLLLLGGLLFFVGLGSRDLVSSHEARAAQNAQMILDEGHWLVPRLFDQHLELQKPPLYYWLVACFAWLLGGPVDVWAVRLPAALSACCTVLFLYYLGIKRGRPVAGLLAALVLASSLHFTWLARVGRIDMPLCMTITFAIGGFYLASSTSRSSRSRVGWRLWGYAWLGVGLLLKGPIAVVLPAVVAFAYWLPRVRTDGFLDAMKHAWRGNSLWWGVPCVLAIAGPWYLCANWQTCNRLFEVFLWYHNVERGLGGTETLASHPFWFYLPRVCVDLFPWSLLIPIMVVYWRRPSKLLAEGNDNPQDAEALGGLLWFSAILLFLSCMSFKRADYLLPAYPGMAVFLGACAERWWSTRRPRWASIGLAATLTIYSMGWMFYLSWYLPHEEGDWPYRRIAADIRRKTDGPVIFFRAESHVLAYHVRLTDTILEWENLRKWADRPIPVYFVMPENCANEWQKHLPADALVEVLRTEDYVAGRRDRSLVVFRNRSDRGTGSEVARIVPKADENKGCR